MIDLDEHLVAIAAGDAGAFARWLAGAEPALRGRLRPFAHQVDTEAVLQEALLRAWQVAPRVEKRGPNSLLALTHRMAKNLAIDAVRKHGREVELVEDVPNEPAPPDPMLRKQIQICRDKLPKPPAMAWSARQEGAGRRDVELAASVGMKPNTFLKNIGRARSFLAQCLERAGVRVRP